MHSIANGKILPYPSPSLNLRLFMKLLSFLLLATSLQVCATGLGQIKLVEKKAPLEKVLKSIKNQSGYDLVYDVAMTVMITIQVGIMVEEPRVGPGVAAGGGAAEHMVPGTGPPRECRFMQHAWVGSDKDVCRVCKLDSGAGSAAEAEAGRLDCQ